MKNRIYLCTVSKQENDQSFILDTDVLDNFEDAMQFGKYIIESDCYNNEDKVKINNYTKYISESALSYNILISEISKNRKRFNNSKELMDYFNTNIKNISNDNLYDFLLSLVNSIDNLYDYFGNILYRYIENMNFKINPSIYRADVDFNEEDCKKGIYTFNYK